jgi:class 3 adenylate cyclase
MSETRQSSRADFGISPLNGATADLLHVEASFLCADVVRFTAMTRLLGDRTSFRLMRRVARLVQAEAARREGLVVEVRGDSFLLSLPHPRHAVECARAIHAALAEDAATQPDGGVEVRMAIHSGWAIRAGDQFFGLNVILPYRLLALTSPGQIAITDQACERALSALGCSAPRRTFLPKGFLEEVAFRVVDARDADIPETRDSALAGTRSPRTAPRSRRLRPAAAAPIAASAP